MLLYFKAYNHHNYALEAFRLLTLTTGVAGPHFKEQITWSCKINTRSSQGNNIPADLHNEHLNRTLKDCICGIGANVTKERIVSVSHAIQSLTTICHQADEQLGVTPTSTIRSYSYM